MSGFDPLVDGGLVALYLAATLALGLAARRRVHKVEDYLVAGRGMDVHLGVASLAATEFGIVTCMYAAQAGYKYGFAGATPGILMAAAMLLVGLTGFCIRPLRESGAMTLPELFERRFGPGVRRAAGVVVVLGGLLNMGVFLRMGGEFLVLVAGVRAGALELVMTGLLAMVLVYTVLGGMLSVLVTDFLQFVVMSAGLIAVTVLLLARVGWSELVATVERRIGPGGFDPLAHVDRGVEYVVFQALVALAITLTWQTVIARVLAARDARTGGRVFTRTSFFFVCRFLLPGIWGIAALATLAPSAFDRVPPEIAGDPSLHAMPLLLAEVLPVGLTGLLVAAMLAADMSTDSSYLLGWSSVIYNDVLAPFRRPGWSERKGLLLNRALVLACGAFLLLYGLWYPLEGDLWDYLTVTGTVYLASLSVLLVACCYWKGASRAGAYAAIAAGTVFPLGFLVLEKLEATRAFARDAVGPNLAGILAFAAAAGAMAVGSWVAPGRATVAEARR